MTQSVHLLVDVGNSQIKWCRAASRSDEPMQPAHAFPWETDLLPNLLDNNWGTLQDSVTQVSVANVAGNQVQEILTQWCLDHWKITPQSIVTTPQFSDVLNGYENYQSLGVDRWLAVIAAHHFYPQTANIVIDCGSAITVDTVLAGGEHLPGPIIPGLQTMVDGLLSKTDLAKYVPAENDTKMPPEGLQAVVKDTKTAILAGANFATSKALDAIVSEIEAQLPQSSKFNIIGTGGAAQSVMALSTLSTRKTYLHEPDLVLKGLACFIENQ